MTMMGTSEAKRSLALLTFSKVATQQMTSLAFASSIWVLRTSGARPGSAGLTTPWRQGLEAYVKKERSFLYEKLV